MYMLFLHIRYFHVYILHLPANKLAVKYLNINAPNDALFFFYKFYYSNITKSPLIRYVSGDTLYP